jgi:heterodisulfide reductase subunit C
MSHDSHGHDGPVGLAEKAKASTGESVYRCYQCGKCTAGCPLADEMDVPPSQILRLLQLGIEELAEMAVGAFSPWLCLTCEMCHARCPQEVDLPKIMEFLREEALRRNMVNPKAKDILAFHECFLSSMRSGGRLFEVGLISKYKMRTFHLFQDVLMAPKMLLRGKLHLLPHAINGKAAVARIFERTIDKKEGHE